MSWSKQAALELSINEASFAFLGGKISKIAPQNFKLRTATATIGIRGSHFDGYANATTTEVMGDGATIVSLTTGQKILLDGFSSAFKVVESGNIDSMEAPTEGTFFRSKAKQVFGASYDRELDTLDQQAELQSFTLDSFVDGHLGEFLDTLSYEDQKTARDSVGTEFLELGDNEKAELINSGKFKSDAETYLGVDMTDEEFEMVVKLLEGKYDEVEDAVLMQAVNEFLYKNPGGQPLDEALQEFTGTVFPHTIVITDQQVGIMLPDTFRVMLENDPMTNTGYEGEVFSDYFELSGSGVSGGGMSIPHVMQQFPDFNPDLNDSFVAELPGLEFTDYGHWGVWGATEGSTQPDHIIFGFFATGDPNKMSTSKDFKDFISAGANQQISYSGAAIGMVIGANATQGIVNGTANMTVDFNSGYVMDGSVVLGQHTVNMLPSNLLIDASGVRFNGGTQLNGLGGGNYQGQFYGQGATDFAKEGFGNFQAVDGVGNTAVGSFGVARP